MVTGTPSESRSASLLSYDLLRIVAMVAIVYQHLLPIHGLSPGSGLPLDIGQFGVTVFCGMSGYFAFRSRASNSRAWFAARLTKVLPAYWIALTVAFAANAIVHYKPVSVRIVSLQYLGLAALLDGPQRIGQPYWFITLILGCYALAAILRRRPWAIPLGAGAALLLMRQDLWLSIHTVSFLACGALAIWRPAWLGPALMAIAGLAAATRFPVLIYPFLALASIQVAMVCPWESGRTARLAGRRTYEFFLVHGMVYLGLAMILGLGFLPNLVVGTVFSVLAAYFLQRITRSFVELASTGIGTVPRAKRCSTETALPG